MKINKMKLDIAMANKKYSAKKLAKVCGVSQVTINRITKGIQKARPETIGKIADALEVKAEELIEKQ